MRARNLKPGFFKNDQLAECCFAARILFEGLWCLADREGRLCDRPKKIKAEVFPYDNLDVDELLKELSDNNLIVRYEVDGECYIEISTFLKHQKPHPKEAQSTIPTSQSASTTVVSEEAEPKKVQEVVPGQEQAVKSSYLGATQTIPRCDPDNTLELSSPAESCFLESLNPVSLNPESLNPESKNKDLCIPNGIHVDRPSLSTCPHQKIVALYAECLPELRQVREWTAARQKLLAARWKERAERQSLDWWRDYFLKVKASDFLMGRCPPRKDGSPPWMADLEWLIRPSNMPKVLEGKYDNRRAKNIYDEAKELGYQKCMEQSFGDYGSLREELRLGDG